MSQAAVSFVGQAAANHELAGLVARNTTAYALLNLTLLSTALPAASRALSSVFTFEMEAMGVGSLRSRIAEWRRHAVKHIKDAASGIPGLKDIVEVIQESVELAEQGLEALLEAVHSIAKLAGQLFRIYKTFSPLVPIFQGDNFLIDLLSDYGNIKALVSFVRQLFGTAATLYTLSNACAEVGEILGELSDVYDDAMSKVSEDDERRLDASDGRSSHIFSYTNFLQGIDFESIHAKMRKFSAAAADNAETLQTINATLSPVFDRFDESRSLRGPALEPEDYQHAIEIVVPTWQAVEGLGLSVCEAVMEADHEADALVCRAKNFVNKVGDLVGLRDLLEECSVSDEADECPNKILSDDVADLITDHSGTLGWLVYLAAFLAASCGCLGASTVAVKKMRAPTSFEEQVPLARV